LHDDPIPLRQHRPEVPEGLEQAVLRCLMKDRNNRFPSVFELGRALLPFALADSRIHVERAERVLGVRDATMSGVAFTAALFIIFTISERRNAKKKSKTETTPTHQKPQPQPEPVEEANNVVPFGQGGPVSGPYGVFSAGGAKGGFGVTGGGGDFGSRYAWYVRVVQQKVSENWLKYEVDPRIGRAQRVYITFDVLRDGRPASVQVEQSSGVPSLDQSAVRAIQRIDTFGPLPPDYSGNKVSVEFWFDYKR